MCAVRLLILFFSECAQHTCVCDAVKFTTPHYITFTCRNVAFWREKKQQLYFPLAENICRIYQTFHATPLAASSQIGVSDAARTLNVFLRVAFCFAGVPVPSSAPLNCLLSSPAPLQQQQQQQQPGNTNNCLCAGGL